MSDWKAKQAARSAMAIALRDSFPGLIPASAKCGSLVAAAKNMRIELAEAFPGIKFSVKSRRFSGGNSIDVGWTDGPCAVQVDEIVNRYEAGTFDGSTDSYTYSESAWRDAFGDAKYVMTTRHYSDAAISSATRTVFNLCAGNLADATRPTPDDYNNNRLWSVPVNTGAMHDSLQEHIAQVLHRRTWALTRLTKFAAMPEEAEAAS